MLMNMKDLLAPANEHNFAIPAFNIGCAQLLEGAIECSEKLNAPVILAFHPTEVEFNGDSFMKYAIDRAHNAKVPCCIHLDHGGTIEEIMRAIRDGFTSVMIDASHNSFEDNIAITKQVVGLAHPLNVSVEAELGTIGSIGNNFEGGSTDVIYTNPDDAVKFIEATGIDCLAIAIGTAHGLYPAGFMPKLALDLLTEIKSKVTVPLVLHGGSSNDDGEIAEAVKRGINKINISSEVKEALYQGLRKTCAEHASGLVEPRLWFDDALKEMRASMEGKIRLYNADDKVKYYSL